MWAEPTTDSAMPDSAPAEPPLAPLIDPVALEARLAEARLRRARALASPRPAASRWTAARLAAALRRPARLPAFLAGLAAGVALAAAPALLRPTPPVALTEIAAPAPPAAGMPSPAPVADLGPVAAAAPAALAPRAAAALRPEPRPPGFVSPAPGPVVQSARNRPASSDPVARAVGELNAATLGQAAAALGLRQRVALPGLTLTLDRRGLRLHPHPATPKRGRRAR
jgi:nicotinate-nucleotide--dimethylbenzimidazole phosphoribosyltransferase